MSSLLNLPLAGGGSVVVEVDEPGPAGPVTRGGRATQAVVEAGETFEAAVARVTPAFQSLVRELREAASSPDEIQIEFGLKLTVEMGAIIARTGGEANFRVSVRWSRDG